MWGAKFWPPFFLSFPFSFLLSPSSTFRPPLLLFTFFFHLIFLLHPTISSLKNYFPKLLNLPSLISLNIYIYIYIFSDPFGFGHFSSYPFSKSSFLCTKMSSSSNGPSFLTFHGKKYHPSLEWNDEEELLQDPKTHAPHSHMDFKVSFSLFLCLEKCYFHASLKVWCGDIVILLCALVGIRGIVWLIML